MNRLVYPLNEMESDFIDITWHGDMERMEIRAGGVLIGRFVDRANVVSGDEFFLPDGTLLEVRLETGWLSRGLLLRLDGKRLLDPNRLHTSVPTNAAPLRGRMGWPVARG